MRYRSLEEWQLARRGREAIARARVVYPAPVAELIDREIRAATDPAWRWLASGKPRLTTALIDAILRPGPGRRR